LLVLRVTLANDPDHALALDHLAVLADRLDTRTYLHGKSPTGVRREAAEYRRDPADTQPLDQDVAGLSAVATQSEMSAKCSLWNAPKPNGNRNKNLDPGAERCGFCPLDCMPDDSELPSTRRILAHEAAGPDGRDQDAPDPGDDEDFRRVIARLRAVLQVREG